MNFLYEGEYKVSFYESFFSNKTIILPIISWFLAQLIKFIQHFIKHQKIDFRKFVASGGMPSSHSAISTCLAAVAGVKLGFDSVEFAIAVIFALIVMADAAGVRRAAGKQAEVLNKIIYHSDELRLENGLKELLGHTPIQVIAGAALGMLIGVIFA